MFIIIIIIFLALAQMKTQTLCFKCSNLRKSYCAGRRKNKVTMKYPPVLPINIDVAALQNQITLESMPLTFTVDETN